jgi:DNA-directed RNA polymerase specialized sigma24 family protein
MLIRETKPNLDRYETFVRLYTQHETNLRSFSRSLLPSWDDVDEVMQQTAIVLWRKFDQFDLNTEFMKWACVVARFEILAYRRNMARDKLVLSGIALNSSYCSGTMANAWKFISFVKSRNTPGPTASVIW